MVGKRSSIIAASSTQNKQTNKKNPPPQIKSKYRSRLVEMENSLQAISPMIADHSSLVGWM